MVSSPREHLRGSNTWVAGSRDYRAFKGWVHPRKDPECDIGFRGKLRAWPLRLSGTERLRNLRSGNLCHDAKAVSGFQTKEGCVEAAHRSPILTNTAETRRKSASTLGKTRTLTVRRLISCWTVLSMGLDVRIFTRGCSGRPKTARPSGTLCSSHWLRRGAIFSWC